MEVSTYEEFKNTLDIYERMAKAASKALNEFPRGEMGLTPDSVKFSAEYRAVKSKYERAARAIRDLNGAYAKTYAKEIKADRAARRGM